ncbi:MAG: hypothetical protein IJ784_04500 [Ruminiclostridium sp.]|nr:hypothetical protein [Ruminiclostridium sp.]
MRNRLHVCGFIAAVIAAAGACGNTHTEMNVPQTEPTAAETAFPQTGAITDAGSDNITVTETVQPADAPPDKLYADDFADERFRGRLDAFKAQNDEFMRTNRFIDYKFIYSPETSDIPEDVQEKAVRCTAESEQYIESSEYTEMFLADPESRIGSEEITADDVMAFINDGKIVPKFLAGWEYDFDGDGKNERFLAVQYPWLSETEYVFFPTQLIFENSGGEMSVVDQVDYLNDDIAAILDYGDFKQFFLNGYGYMSLRDHTTLFGVVEGECREMLSGRIYFYKKGCFLSYGGWMGISRFMIYDTSKNEYRDITGYPADIEKLRVYDPALASFEEGSGQTSYLYYVVGGKYVLIPGSTQCYKYENGRITACSDPLDCIEIYPLFKPLDDDEWFDVDIGEALEKSGAVFGASE